MITNGVNENGVYYVKDGDNYTCHYYIGEGIELHKEFIDVTQKFIDCLTYEDLIKK